MNATNWLIDKLSANVIGNVLERHKDVILVTGGCSGLGLELVRELVRRSYPKIVVFDLLSPGEQDRLSGVHYFKCDISDHTQILDAKVEIDADIGSVTCVINNAGVMIDKKLIEMSFEEIDKVLKVNLFSHFYINRIFLPPMVENKRGYIVTISSVLGFMSPSKLTTYGASKSGLIAMHESLAYEMGPPLNLANNDGNGVKFLLVCPGQIKTKMFEHVKTPSHILAPQLNPTFLAQNIVRDLELGRRGEVVYPIYGNFLSLFRSIPWPVTQVVRLISGMDESMNSVQQPETADATTSK